MANKNAPRIYVDACPLIDMAKHRAKLALDLTRENDVWTLSRLLESSRAGEIKILTSMLTVAECQHVGEDAEKKDDIREFFSSLLLSGKGGITLLQTTMTVLEEVEKLKAKGIVMKGADLMHFATAIAHRCDEFLTTDKNIAKKEGLSAMRVVAARNTTLLHSKYRAIPLPLPPSEKIENEQTKGIAPA
jgi:predicted nucleic acid-binding protein